MGLNSDNILPIGRCNMFIDIVNTDLSNIDLDGIIKKSRNRKGKFTPEIVEAFLSLTNHYSNIKFVANGISMIKDKNKAFIFDIQRSSFVDGPGMRTVVFFKGCNLNCKWCHNPEGICGKTQLLFYKEKCTTCGECKKVCDNNYLYP